MKLKSFITELHNEVGQGLTIPADVNELDADTVNDSLDLELGNLFTSPEGGIQAIRNVLDFHHVEFPALYDLNPEGDEVVFSVGIFYLYIIYSLTDDGQYEFYAELTDEDGLVDILSDEGDDEEE